MSPGIRRSRLVPQDPWDVVAQAREERRRILGGWIASVARRAPASPWACSERAVAFALLPLAAGYFFSYLMRNVSATLAGDMTAELGIGADALGQLTSAYLLVFAAAQLPVGVLLDRFGPRLVQSSLLLLAVVGAALCSLTSDYATLLLGRALVGLGTASGLVAGLKASAAWFPRERLPLVNGAFVMCGGLGALAATLPVERALRGGLDWHGVYGALAVGALAVAAAVAAFVPEQRSAADARARAPGSEVRLRDIVRDPRFRRFAPVSALSFGAVLAVQGLWTGPWLADVNGLSRPEVAADLAWMALALIVAAPCWGLLTSWLRPRVRLANAMAGASVLLMGCEVAILAGCGTGPGVCLLPWCGFAFFGGMTVLSYSVVAEHFPAGCLGRANAAMNVLHIGSSFVLQLVFGQVVALWAPTAGRYPARAYEAALVCVVLTQAAALAWFAWPRRRPRDRPGRAVSGAQDLDRLPALPGPVTMPAPLPGGLP